MQKDTSHGDRRGYKKNTERNRLQLVIVIIVRVRRTMAKGLLNRSAGDVTVLENSASLMQKTPQHRCLNSLKARNAGFH